MKLLGVVREGHVNAIFLLKQEGLLCFTSIIF